jgi:hypothetical protein
MMLHIPGTVMKFCGCVMKERHGKFKKLCHEVGHLLQDQIINKDLFRMQFDISLLCYNLTVSVADIMSRLDEWCCDRFQIECS